MTFVNTNRLKELQDAIDWQDQIVIQNCLSRLVTNENVDSICLDRVIKNQKILNLIGQCQIFDAVWSSKSIIDACKYNATLRSWLLQNKIGSINEEAVFINLMKDSFPNESSMEIAFALHNRKQNPSWYTFIYCLTIASRLFNLPWTRKILSTLPRQGKTTMPAMSVAITPLLLNTLLICKIRVNNSSFSKRIVERTCKRLVSRPLRSVCFGFASLRLPHLLLCFLCECLVEPLTNVVPPIWISNTVSCFTLPIKSV